MHYNVNIPTQRARLARLAQAQRIKTIRRVKGKSVPVSESALREQLFESVWGRSWGHVSGYKDLAEFDGALERAIKATHGAYGSNLMHAQMYIKAGMDAKDEATRLHAAGIRNLPEAQERLAEARLCFELARAAQAQHEAAA